MSCREGERQLLKSLASLHLDWPATGEDESTIFQASPFLAISGEVCLTQQVCVCSQYLKSFSFMFLDKEGFATSLTTLKCFLSFRELKAFLLCSNIIYPSCTQEWKAEIQREKSFSCLKHSHGPFVCPPRGREMTKHVRGGCACPHLPRVHRRVEMQMQAHVYNSTQSPHPHPGNLISTGCPADPPFSTKPHLSRSHCPQGAPRPVFDQKDNHLSNVTIT